MKYFFRNGLIHSSRKKILPRELRRSRAYRPEGANCSQNANQSNRRKEDEMESAQALWTILYGS